MKKFYWYFYSFLVQASLLLPQTGKISGTVTDSQTGDRLIGANVTVQGTSMGAAADLDGHYVILNISPGTYILKFSMVGYSAYLVRNVIVNIDQTTNIDAKLASESIQQKKSLLLHSSLSYRKMFLQAGLTFPPLR